MKIPKSMQDKYADISTIISDFSDKYLNEEYTAMSLSLLALLCRKRPSPILSGKPNTWACGIIYAIGKTNFLFDRSQTPHIRASELAGMFGISQSTAGNKASEIKRVANIKPLDPEWTLPSRLFDNPMVWMFKTASGFMFDVRYAPRATQAEFFDAGLIPFIPADLNTAEVSPEDS